MTIATDAHLVVRKLVSKRLGLRLWLAIIFRSVPGLLKGPWPALTVLLAAWFSEGNRSTQRTVRNAQRLGRILVF
jgi:hypothetical protein